jgi:hypothetical protein
MSYSELVWSSIPETLDDHMAQYFDRTQQDRFDYWVEVAREVINRLNGGELCHELVYVIHTPYTLGELLLKWELNKFLNKVEPEPQLVAGNLSINYI